MGASALLGRSAAVAVLVLTAVLALFTWSGGTFFPVGLALAALLLKWPSNRPALLLTGLFSSVFAVTYAVLLPTVFSNVEYQELIGSGLLLTVTSLATALISLTALVIRLRRPTPLAAP